MNVRSICIVVGLQTTSVDEWRSTSARYCLKHLSQALTNAPLCNSQHHDEREVLMPSQQDCDLCQEYEKVQARKWRVFEKDF